MPHVLYKYETETIITHIIARATRYDIKTNQRGWLRLCPNPNKHTHTKAFLHKRFIIVKAGLDSNRLGNIMERRNIIKHKKEINLYGHEPFLPRKKLWEYRNFHET